MAFFVRKLNKYKVLQCIFENGPVSNEEIVRITSLSRPTVMEIVNELMKDSTVKKSGRGESTGGREPILLDINESCVFAIGIDFEYPRVNIGIMNLLRKPVISESFECEAGLSPTEIIEKIIEKVDLLIDGFSYPRSDIIGIGIALPGIIDTETGTSTHIERIDGWENIPIRQIFEDKYQIPIYIQNDVHLLAILEQQERHDLPSEFIFVGVRSGIGMAFIINNDVYTGMKGNAGFLGHMTVDFNGRKCVCGRNGCVETAAGQLSLKQQYLDLSGKPYEAVDRSSRFYNYLYEQALAGDKIADELLVNAGTYLAYGIANVVKMLEIPTIVIEGSRPILEEGKYQTVFWDILRKQLFENINNEITVEISVTENEMIICACSEVVFEEYVREKYSLSDALDKVHFKIGKRAT